MVILYAVVPVLLYEECIYMHSLYMVYYKICINIGLVSTAPHKNNTRHIYIISFIYTCVYYNCTHMIKCILTTLWSLILVRYRGVFFLHLLYSNIVDIL